MDKKYIDVVCVIIENQGKILLAQNGINKENAHLWEFPGGKVNENESLFEAAHREIYEELGVEVFPIKILDFIEKYHLNRIFRLYPIVAQWKLEQKIILTEHLEVKWVDPQMVKENFLAPSNIDLLKVYRIHKKMM